MILSFRANALLVATILGPVLLAQSTFTHLAGSTGGAGSEDGTSSSARFRRPSAVAADAAGNFYVIETLNHTVRKISAAGDVTTVAGLAGVTGSSNGTGSAARFNWPEGIAVDAAGVIYVADTLNHTIRKITTDRQVSTLAGSAGLTGSTNGTGSAARFDTPTALAIGPDGNIYVADLWNGIRKVTPAGVVTTFTTAVSKPAGLAFDTGGDLYVAERTGTSTIKRVTAAAAVSTVPGTTVAAEYAGVAVANGTIFVTLDDEIDLVNNGLFTHAGTSQKGSADGTGTNARLWAPAQMTVDNAGSLIVADTRNNTIRRCTTAGVVTTIAGQAAAFGAVDATGSAARFRNPNAVALDSGGNLIVSDQENCTIRKVTTAGVVTTIAGLAGDCSFVDGSAGIARFAGPKGVAVDASDNIYVTDDYTVRKISGGQVSTFAGSEGAFGSGDGNGTAASFYNPWGLAFDTSGNLFVTDNGACTLRRIAPNGDVLTIAGSPLMCTGDDGTGSNGRFAGPEGLAVDSSGNVYVADSDTSRIRKVTSGAVVTTFAGSTDGTNDGTLATARFDHPSDVALDGAGNLYVADDLNNSVRRISGSSVTTLGGLSGRLNWGSADGTAGGARFERPIGLAVTSSGTIYAVDFANSAIRVGRTAIADVATIDSPSGTASVTRQLDTSPQTATSWQWRVIRRPAGSTASLSSSSIRNPTFTPDVADLYVFRLTATSAGGTRITEVSLTAAAAPPGAPANLVATASGSSSVSITWTAAAGASGYELARNSGGGFTTLVSGLTNPSHTDTTVAANSAYLYKVRALGTGSSDYSNVDLAVTTTFSDDPIAAGTTPIRAAHVSELRTAVHAVRTLAGLGSFTFADASLAGAGVRSLHITQLRSALADARTALALPATVYATTAAAGTVVQAADVNSLRNGVR